MVEMSQYLIGFAVFTLIIGCGVGFIYEMTNANTGDPTLLQGNDSQDINTLNSTIYQYGALSSSVNIVSANLSNANPNDNSAFLGSVNALFTAGWTAIHFILTSWSFIGTSYTAACAYLHLPPFIGAILILIGTLIILFGVIKIITRSVF